MRFRNKRNSTTICSNSEGASTAGRPRTVNSATAQPLEQHDLAARSSSSQRQGMHRLKELLALLAVAASVMATAPAALASPVTVSKSGAYGYWAGAVDANHCGSDYFGAYIVPITGYITGTPVYKRRRQVIRQNSRIDYWDGSSWVAYKWTGWKRATVNGTDWALLGEDQHDVAPRRVYRVVQFYEWWVSGRRVGRVTNLFDQYSYQSVGGVGPTESRRRTARSIDSPSPACKGRAPAGALPFSFGLSQPRASA